MVKIVHQSTYVNFVNSSLDNSSYDEISESLTKELHIWNTVRLSLRGKKIIINQRLSKLWYKVQIYTIPRYIKKEIEKRKYNFLRNNEKNQTSQILRHSLDVLDIDTQLNYLKIKLIQILLNPTNSLWKYLMLYWLNINLILNSYQGLALLRQKKIPRYNSHKNLQKQDNEDFFIQLINVWLHFTNNNFSAPMSMEEILHQPIHLNPYTKLLDFSSNKSCFYCIPSKNISDNYN